jgi:hypothetical protein
MRNSRIFFFTIALLGAVSCRRPAGSAPAPSAAVEDVDVSERVRTSTGRPRVIWIGLDGLYPDFLDRLSTVG